MGAMLNNIPATIVYDRSFIQSVDSSGSQGTITYTGTTGLMIDSNSSTYYKIQASVSGATAPYSLMVIDYGKIFFNCQLSYKLDYYCELTNGSASTYYLAYSIDNSNWTVIHTGTIATAETKSYNEATNFLNARYIKIGIDSPNGGSPNMNWIKAYEVRFMGSG